MVEDEPTNSRSLFLINSVASTTTLSNKLTCHAELDSRADTCCFGQKCLIVAKSHKVVRVKPFLDSLGSADKIPIVTVAVAYDDPVTSDVHILVFYQVLYL